MKPENEFYIGWQNILQKRSRSLLIRFLFFIFILMGIVVITYTINQNEFPNSKYELGNITEHEGHIFLDPKPVLVQIDQNGDRTSLQLVSYGKFGAERDLMEWNNKSEKNAFGSYVKIQGTVVAYDGETVLELTDKARAITLVEGRQRVEREVMPEGVKSLSGEIVDPKCFFGAMKPGYGKIHKSCAIRCLSGGIPPVLVSDTKTYYTILLPDEFDISHIYDDIGKPIKLTGNISVIDGKSYLQLKDVAALTDTDFPLLDANLSMCML